MMTEIYCDSATLHIYTGFGREVTDPQLGERQFFDRRKQVALPMSGDQAMQVYAWLWRDNQPASATNPVWLWPNDTYNPGPIVTVSSVDPNPDPMLQLLAHETGSQGDED